MKFKALFILVIFVCLSTCLIVFSKTGAEGAINGINLCYNVIIPSLFPFTVFSLIIFQSGFFNSLQNFLHKRKINIDINGIAIFMMSCIGGFPVGAKLINSGYESRTFTRNNAELMLGYCVNSAPSFIILAVGVGILNNIKLGYVLFCANLIASVILWIILSRFMDKKATRSASNYESKPFSDLFVDSTYEATNAMFKICGFVILFSTIIGIIDGMFDAGRIKSILLSLLEITNGAMIVKNIYVIAFLLGFSGICVHFQVLSMCSSIRPGYVKFLIFRVVHGLLMVVLTKIIIKIFGINIDVISSNTQYTYLFSEVSVTFGIAFLALCVLFMLSVGRKKNIL